MSLSKNTIKLINSLRHKKFRQKYNIFVAEGSKIANEVLTSPNYTVSAIYTTETWLETNIHSLPNNVEVHKINSADMAKISSLTTPTEILMLLNIPNRQPEMSFTDGFHLYLDDVQDPGNVGTLIRSAEWFGCKSVIRSTGSADFYSAKVVQATMGTFTHIPLYTMTPQDLVELNVPIIATRLDGISLYKAQILDRGIITISNEGQGLSPFLDANASLHLHIPRAIGSKTESLNAGLAGGILFSHILGGKGLA